MKITQCTGEGQGECKRCADKGKWNRMWMSFLYHIEGMEGCYCEKCVREIEIEEVDSVLYSVKMDCKQRRNCDGCRFFSQTMAMCRIRGIPTDWDVECVKGGAE